MRYSNAQPVKYEAAIQRLILSITDDSESAREALAAIQSSGVHPRGQVFVAHGRASRHVGAIMVEWESPSMIQHRISITRDGVKMTTRNLRDLA
jgi:hypothetical protein